VIGALEEGIDVNLPALFGLDLEIPAVNPWLGGIGWRQSAFRPLLQLSIRNIAGPAGRRAAVKIGRILQPRL
jgi:hypothetical protein